MSVLVAGGCHLAARAIEAQSAEVAALLSYLAALNLVLALFNLVPGFPLDGGRLLRAVVWHGTGDQLRATAIAARAGQIVAFSLLFLGFARLMVGHDFIGGLWLGLIAWFLLMTAGGIARQAAFEQQLAGTSVAAAMSPNPTVVPARASLQRLVDDFIRRHNLEALPVVDADRWLGIVFLQDVLRVPREAWPRTDVATVMRHRDAFDMVAPGDPLGRALTRLAAHPAGQLPVVVEGQIVGTLSRADVERYLRVRASLNAI
jgi:CBS domain-containing protein